MDRSVIMNLQEYITEEMTAELIYKELARMAPCEQDRQLLLEFAEDERNHAEDFKKIYRNMTGRRYEPTIMPIVLTQPYREILRERVLDESGDFRKYGEQYLMTQPSELKDVFYLARTDEGVHAWRLLYLLSK